MDDEVRRLRADMRVAFAQLTAAQDRERELADARDRFRTLADILARREMEGDAAGFDRLRAERETLDVETDPVIATTDCARAQATTCEFLRGGAAPVATRGRRGSQSFGSRNPPGWRPCSSKPTRFAASCARFNMKLMQLALLLAPLNAGGRQNRRSSRGRSPQTFGAGDVGSVVMVMPRFRCSTARARNARWRPRERPRPKRALRLSAWCCVARLGALRAAVVQRREAAERYRTEAVNSAAQIERIAQVSYDAGERSILELLDAYRIGIVGARAPGDARSRRSAGRD